MSPTEVRGALCVCCSILAISSTVHRPAAEAPLEEHMAITRVIVPAASVGKPVAPELLSTLTLALHVSNREQHARLEGLIRDQRESNPC